VVGDLRVAVREAAGCLLFLFSVLWRLEDLVLSKAASTRRPLALSLGMAFSVEISSGQSRVLDFVLSPIAEANSKAERGR
jgi:hypothetical protein